MFVKKMPTAGRISLYYAEAYRDPVTKKPKSRTLEFIGYLDDLEKEYKDPVAHFKEIAKSKSASSKKANMFSIGEINLNEEFDLTDEEQVNKNASIPTIDNSFCLGQLPLSVIYHELEIDKFITNRRKFWGLKANVESIFRLIVFGRILFPGSKYATWQIKDRLMLGSSSFSDDDIYRALSFFSKYEKDLIIHLNDRITKLYKRDTSLMFYDVTNYYWEIDNADNDTFTDTGEVENPGLRKRGCSKEHRPEPIVQLGLFMDKDGLPVTYGLFPGNNPDCTTFIPMINETRENLGLNKMIYIADKGMMSGTNIANIIANKQGYIISDKVRKQKKDVYNFIFDESGYTIITKRMPSWKVFEENERTKILELPQPYTGDMNAMEDVVVFKYKSRLTPQNEEVWKNFDMGSGKKVNIKANKKQIVFWSRDYDLRAKIDRANAIEKANKTGSVYNNHGANKYYTKGVYNIETGELYKNLKADRYLDANAIKEDEKYDGYYLIETNVVGTCPEEKPWIGEARFRNYDLLFELNRAVSDTDIIEMYRGLWKIEESFKITKSEFNTRPIYVRKEESIKAHFLSCFIALLITRIMEVKKLKDSKIDGSSIPYTKIISSLRSTNVIRMNDKNIFINSYYDAVLKEISKVMNINLGKKYYSKQELRSMNNATKDVEV